MERAKHYPSSLALRRFRHVATGRSITTCSKRFHAVLGRSPARTERLCFALSNRRRRATRGRSLTIRPSQFRSLAPRPTEQERTTSAGVGLGIGRRESPNSPWGKNAAASLSRSLEDLPTVFDFRRCYRRIRNFVVPLSSAVPVDRSGRHVPAADGMMQGEDGKMKPCEERETCDRRAIGSRSRIASG